MRTILEGFAVALGLALILVSLRSGVTNHEDAVFFSTLCLWPFTSILWRRLR